MKKNTNRLLAMLMAAIMLLGMLPSAALAYSVGADGACNHKWGEWHYSGRGTCGDWDLRWRQCEKCGYGNEEEYQIKHDWGERKEEYPATCTEKGMEVAKCNRCGEEKYWYTDPLGHDWASAW